MVGLAGITWPLLGKTLHRSRDPACADRAGRHRPIADGAPANPDLTCSARGGEESQLPPLTSQHTARHLHHGTLREGEILHQDVQAFVLVIEKLPNPPAERSRERVTPGVCELQRCLAPMPASCLGTNFSHGLEPRTRREVSGAVPGQETRAGRCPGLEKGQVLGAGTLGATDTTRHRVITPNPHPRARGNQHRDATGLPG